MTKILIRVTKDILEKSAGCDSIKRNKNCAVALAVKEIFPDACVHSRAILPFKRNLENWIELLLTVGKGYTMLDTLYKTDGILLPEEITGFIRGFDSTTIEKRKNLPEQEFELEIPDWALEEISEDGIEEAKRIIDNSPTLSLIEA